MVRLSCCLQNSGLTARLHDSTSSPNRSADRSLSREASTASAGTKRISDVFLLNRSPLNGNSQCCVCIWCDGFWCKLVFLTLCGDWRLGWRGSCCDRCSLIRQWAVSASCRTALTVCPCRITEPSAHKQHLDMNVELLKRQSERLHGSVWLWSKVIFTSAF